MVFVHEDDRTLAAGFNGCDLATRRRLLLKQFGDGFLRGKWYVWSMPSHEANFKRAAHYKTWVNGCPAAVPWR